MSAGYFNSDPLPRPTGTIPLIQDPRDPTATVGGAAYPSDATGALGTAFENEGTSQPKFDARVDQEINGGRITYQGGVAGTSGIIHTGIGPFNIQPGSVMGYGKVNYRKDALKVNFFTNLTEREGAEPAAAGPAHRAAAAAELLDPDLRRRGRRRLPRRHAPGVQRRRQRAPQQLRHHDRAGAENRTELGAYVQDEIFLDKVRLTIGGRIDKFGNLDDPVFSPRLAAVFKPADDHSLRVSFNRAFRSPSVINNFLDISDRQPDRFERARAAAAAAAAPLVAQPFPLVVKAVGSQLPIGTTPQAGAEGRIDQRLRDRLHRLAAGRHDARRGVLRQRSRREHQLRPAAEQPRPLHRRQPAARLAAAAGDPHAARAARHLPAADRVHLPEPRPGAREGDRALARPADQQRSGPAFVNYSWQAKPTVIDSDNPFPSPGARAAADQPLQRRLQLSTPTGCSAAAR